LVSLKSIYRAQPRKEREPEAIVSQLERLVARVRGEYREMPGLRLTRAEASRFWQVDETTCDAIVRALVNEGFLRRTVGGRFVAAASGEATAKAKADLSGLRPRVA
jgi:hypothetical protein